ncbi:carbamoyltransferase HypF [Craterilacuibacter sp.]|uniref:carbamoyltransferase HypF n=1 Tax=Craterilacuibacter sp. TaxID=2870909 RepID=UPI003F405733
MIIRRTRLTILGRVQGVGFRPHVWHVVKNHGLSGFVKNTGEGVVVELQGDSAALAACLRALQQHLPPLARLDSIKEEALPLQAEEQNFEIKSSSGKTTHAYIPADIATCPNCLAELFDHSNRRYRYPFINCTDCGPRYSITHALPYDREETSMAAFAQCPSCLEEYSNPETRRFHAEPNACPACGPRLNLTDRFGQALKGDATAGALQILKMGRSIAMKGLGGFHLVCDATREDAVMRIRGQKKRQGKPLAVMVLNIAAARRLCHISSEEAALLASRERPIVLLKKREDTDSLLPGVAPELASLGVMLPYTPQQWMLFHEALGRPTDPSWMEEPCEQVWVMTSANPSGEPIVTGNREARERLNQLADVFLLHNRNIVAPCDDSVVAIDNGQALFYRRARGYAPDPLPLISSGPAILALGAQYKNTICILRGQEAFVSPHIGDLDQTLNCEALEASTHHLLELTDVTPAAIACDLDPSHYASQLAEDMAKHYRVPLLHIQHHHAHIASVLAEHGHSGEVLGLALDAFGLGEDGKTWGGELMQIRGGQFELLGQLAPLPLPGGLRTIREPWLMATALLFAMGEKDEAQRRFGRQPAWPAIVAQLEIPFQLQDSSSMALWFSAIAGLAGIFDKQRFDNEALQRLEELAQDCAPLLNGWQINGTQLDLKPVCRHLMTLLHDATLIASVWHATLAAALADWVCRAAATRKIDTVALSGGCCTNRKLMGALLSRLEAAGIKVLRARQLPPNDGGISLGQAWVARQRLQNDRQPADRP